LDAQGFDPRTSRMQSGRATKCTMHPSLILLKGICFIPFRGVWSVPEVVGVELSVGIVGADP
jgi:hypothetical protein